MKTYDQMLASEIPQEIIERDELIASLNTTIGSLQQQVTTMETDRESLAVATQEQLTGMSNALQAKDEQLQGWINNQNDVLNAAREEVRTELNATITSLQAQVQTIQTERDTALQQQGEAETVRDAAVERLRKLNEDIDADQANT